MVRRTQVAIVCALAVVVGVSVAAWLRTRHTGVSSGRCVTVVIASTMGGATIERCGSAAVRFCRANAPSNADVAAACRREGF